MKYEQAMGNALKQIVEHAERYATAYKQEFDTQIGQDHVLGPEFTALLSAVHALLNGPTGNVDCGRLSGAIHRLGEWAECLDENGELTPGK